MNCPDLRTLFKGVIIMSYVNPEVRENFEALFIDLKNEILSRNVCINNLDDLIEVLQIITIEG